LPQVFALKFDPVYTPAGLNTLDGNYAVFGYIVEGGQLLDDLQPGDGDDDDDVEDDDDDDDDDKPCRVRSHPRCWGPG
jgi:cyclophilin family peptidyl-prolyl cis-trans isomerase